jgi:YVTN family beta-propeller protein
MLSRTIRSAIVIAAFVSILLAQSVPTTLQSVVSRRNDPPAVYTVAMQGGQLSLIVVRFAAFGQEMQVLPFYTLPNFGAGSSAAALRAHALGSGAMGTNAIAVVGQAVSGPSGGNPIPPNGPSLVIPDPNEWGFDPWYFPDPSNPDSNLPPPFQDASDSLDSDPFTSLPDPPANLPPAPGTEIFVVNTAGNSVTVVSGGPVANPAVSLTTIEVGQTPSTIAVLPDGSGALVTNLGAGSVSLINSISVVATIPLPGGNPNGIAITPDGTRAYVSNFDNQLKQVYAVDIPSRQVIATIPAGTYSGVVAITPDGSQAWVSAVFDNDLEIIDVATNTPIRTLAGLAGPWGIAFNPAGTLAYVVGSVSGSVYVIDTTTYEYVATIPVGTNPRHIACSGRFVFVTNTGDSTISQIDTTTNTVARTITVGKGPMGIAFVPGN